MINESSYKDFLESKRIAVAPLGMSNIPKLSSHPFPFQKHCIEFGLRAGSFGCFLDTGLGKTIIELEWCENARHVSNGYGLILTPLAVGRQIEKEGKRWGYDIRVIREQSEAEHGINVCNYDRLPLIEPAAFGAVVLDESSIIKNFSGKTTIALIQAFAEHRWRMTLKLGRRFIGIELKDSYFRQSVAYCDSQDRQTKLVFPEMI